MWDNIRKLIDEGASEEQLWEATSMEKREFRRAFRKKYGMTLAEYTKDFYLKRSDGKSFIDWDDIKDELEAQTSITSICNKHHISIHELDERCVSDLGLTLEQLTDNCKVLGEDTLKRIMYDKAKKGDTKMLIWLSKNWLRYSDKNEETIESGNVEVTFKRI